MGVLVICILVLLFLGILLYISDRNDWYTIGAICSPMFALFFVIGITVNVTLLFTGVQLSYEQYSKAKFYKEYLEYVNEINPNNIQYVSKALDYIESTNNRIKNDKIDCNSNWIGIYYRDKDIIFEREPIVIQNELFK